MRKVRFGVVGTNFITDWVIAGARQDARFELKAVCSRSEEKGKEFARKHGIPYVYTSLEEMAGRSDIDAVYIASPNFMHASQSILCMESGKSVLCEKPLASNVAEAKAMIETSRRCGVTLMEAMKPTLTPHFNRVREHLQYAGRVRRYFASFCQYSSRYDKLKEGVVLNAFKPEYSNGATMDLGVYTIYPLVVLFGRPSAIQACGEVLPTGADGQAAVHLIYEGMNATVLYSKISDSYLPAEIQGEKGTLLLDKIQKISEVVFIPHGVATSGKGASPLRQKLDVTADKDEYYYEIAEFINLIQDGKPESEINSHLHSLMTLEITDEIRRQLGVVFPADKNVGKSVSFSAGAGLESGW